MRVHVALALGAVALAASCTASSTSAPSPTPPPTPRLAHGAVAVGVVHTCGAGGTRCPAGFDRRYGRFLQRHDGLPFATPDTAIVGGMGCGGSLRAPFGKARVADHVIRWHEDWVGAGPDCFGGVTAFVRFARPVYDMHSPLEFIATVSSAGRHTHVERYRGYPAPELARWVHHGPGWDKFSRHY